MLILNKDIYMILNTIGSIASIIGAILSIISLILVSNVLIKIGKINIENNSNDFTQKAKGKKNKQIIRQDS